MLTVTRTFLGVDWGEARIGLAIGDTDTRTAVPLGAVSSLLDVLSRAEADAVDAIIIGAPRSLAGDEAFTRQYRTFVEALTTASAKPVIAVDERLSSAAADALAGGKKDKAGRDAVAAMLILQSYIDSLPVA
jgi:putative holliday junction resolvase